VGGATVLVVRTCRTVNFTEKNRHSSQSSGFTEAAEYRGEQDCS